MKKKRVTLALQGGGAFGAFTWGVLDAFLEDDRFEIVGVSGTSAGAMNAVVLLEGLAEGGPQRAREQLAEFWRAVSFDGSLPTLEREVIESFMSIWDPFKLRLTVAQKTTEIFSPYLLNPLELNPLREVMERLIDFELVRRTNYPKLFIAATNVQTGKARLFQRPEMTADMLMASACLPTMFKAVEIDGEFYWDGGYMGNPSLYPLYTETDCADIILVQINPIRRDNIPRTSPEIMERLNEITFNSPLLQEFRAIDFLAVLDAPALRLLAEQAQKRIYLPGELVVREGEPGEELFLIMEGEADVVIKTGDQTTPVATLKKGQFFGEMSLLTGAPRSATVQTKSPLAVTVIGKHAMSRVLSGNPGLADQFGAILTARQSELATTRETADRAARLKSGAEDGKSLTARILKFFRLSGN